MAPEVVDNTGLPSPYDYKVDIWALGITLIELAELKYVFCLFFFFFFFDLILCYRPPHSDVNPMRALFLIPMSPSPTLNNAKQWSSPMRQVSEIISFSDIVCRTQM